MLNLLGNKKTMSVYSKCKQSYKMIMLSNLLSNIDIIFVINRKLLLNLNVGLFNVTYAASHLSKDDLWVLLTIGYP